jgi:hypothetical protein
VAANLTAGAQYGYLLVWVLVAANIMAVLVQYQSAKLGIVTGKSLPEILGERLKPFWRRASGCRPKSWPPRPTSLRWWAGQSPCICCSDSPSPLAP